MVMQNTTSRRHFLIDALRVTAGVAATGSIAAIAQTNAARNAARRVDFHHHFVPPRHLEAILAQRESGRTPPWSPEMSIEEMDKNGIATAMVSLVQPGIWLGGMENSRRLARECNDYGARSEERRVGKECRRRGARWRSKRKKQMDRR